MITRASGEKRPLSMLVWSSLVPTIPLAGLGLVVSKPRTVHRSAPSGPAGLVAGSRGHSEGEEDGHARTLVVRTGNPVMGRSVDD